MKRVPFTALLVVVALVGLGIGAGYGAWQNGQRAPSPVAAAGLSASPSAAGPLVAGGANAGARPTVGTVQKVVDKELTLQAPGGATARVVLADSTTVSRVEGGALSDLVAGTTVTVLGQKQGDVVTANVVDIGGSGATTMVVGPAGQGGQGGQRSQGAQPGAGGAPATGDFARLSGTVDSVAADGFTLATEAGKTKVVVPANARIQKTVQATAADVKEGTLVQVTGDAGADGVVAAKSVLIMPAGQGAGQGRPGS